MQHRIILPGATTLTRLISEVREKATLRLWNKLALIPSAEQRSQLEMLLGPTDCSRLSLLESLKKGPVTISGPAFNEAIERWKTLNDFGLHAENLSTLPAVRLKNLARYAGMTSVFNIARMSPQKRMAVLVAFVLAWETLALDTGGIIFEVKHGGYQPVAADDYAHWAPAEGEPGTTELMAWYAQAQVGDSTFAV
ncbi:hypothetical protein [Escherichia coli]|uniref:hypothetical protein n=1 Tax=Escherichia coli TaxID=562 RepID=UPI000A992638